MEASTRKSGDGTLDKQIVAELKGMCPALWYHVNIEPAALERMAFVRRHIQLLGVVLLSSCPSNWYRDVALSILEQLSFNAIAAIATQFGEPNEGKF